MNLCANRGEQLLLDDSRRKQLRVKCLRNGLDRFDKYFARTRRMRGYRRMNHGHFTVGASWVEAIAEPQELASSLADA